MLNVDRAKRLDRASSFGTAIIASGTGSRTGGGFKDQLGSQLKEDYRRRIQSVLEGMEALSSELLSRIDLGAFEHYLNQMRDLLSDIARNAYALTTEHVMDFRGRQRILSAIDVIDQKLSDLAAEILESNSDKLEYLSKVDEIRGLIMDVLL